jgi:hypothetical protein
MSTIVYGHLCQLKVRLCSNTDYGVISVSLTCIGGVEVKQRKKPDLLCHSLRKVSLYEGITSVTIVTII